MTAQHRPSLSLLDITPHLRIVRMKASGASRKKKKKTKSTRPPDVNVVKLIIKSQKTGQEVSGGGAVSGRVRSRALLTI